MSEKQQKNLEEWRLPKHWTMELDEILPIAYQIAVPFTSDLLVRLAIFGAILLCTWIVSKLISGFTSKALSKRSPNVVQQTRRIVIWFTWLIGILIGLSELGLELTVLLAAVALGGVILAIASRQVLSNLVSYEVLKTYNQFKIGDWIQVDKYFGRVVDVTWMDTTLMSLDNEVLFISNSKIVESIVINKTTPGGTRISVNMVVDKALDISEVEKALMGIGDELREELVRDSEPEVRMIDLDSQSVRLALLLRINNPAKSKLIASEVRKRAKEKLDQLQLNIKS